MRRKGDRLEKFVDDYVIFDLETTGINCNKDKIIEIAAIKVRRGEVVEEFHSLVNPEIPIPASASAVNGISDDMVIDAPVIEALLDEFLEFIRGEVLVGHNIASFDMNILYDTVLRFNGMALDNEYIDTLLIARKLLKKGVDIEDHRLSTLCEFYDADFSRAHRALNDCYMVEECIKGMRNDMKEFGFASERTVSIKEKTIEAVTDKEWKIKIQEMLNKLIAEFELPEKSLYLAQNVGRVTKKITSYSVCIYEPEYPKLPDRKIDQTRNSIVLNIKEKGTALELIVGKRQFDNLDFDADLDARELKSDKSNIHVYIDNEDVDLIEFIKVNTIYSVKNYKSKASTFGCCSRFNECSDAKKCVHVNRLYSMACSYRKNLDAGRIFYGKNRNIDNEEKKDKPVMSKIKVDDAEKERRKSLGLPVTKQLRYMTKDNSCNWEEVAVESYEIVDTYMPSGTHSLLIKLSTQEEVRILAPYFAEMQKPSFVEDMNKGLED